MRTTGQIGLALVAVIALVAGVTYLSHYGPSAGGSGGTPAPFILPEKAAAPVPDQSLIHIPTQLIEWDQGEGEFEKGSRGFHDFWFQNGKQPTVLGLKFRNCKCTDVEAMVLDKDHLGSFHQWFGTGATTILAGLQQGPLACISLLAWEQLAAPKLFGLDMKWQVLETDSKQGVSIPAEGGGLVRVRFEGKKDLRGDFRLKATLWVAPEAHPAERSFGDLEMNLTYVDPITVTAHEVNMESFNANDEKTATIMAYSSTQAGFDLYATQATPSPLVDVKIDDLNSDQIADYVKTAGVMKRVLSAKQVKITVRERISDSQRMDLGPFYRKIWLSRTKDEPEELMVVAIGEVRGEVIVGAPEDRGRIDLKSFRSSSGKSKTIAILAQQPGLELDANDLRVFPENLQAHTKVRLEKLKSVGGEQRNHWHLHFELKPGFPPGKMPEGSAIFLQIAGSNPPRQIRIPIIGLCSQ